MDRFNALDVLKVMEMVKKPHTNEEWIKSLNTEELAQFIADQCADAIRLWKEMQYWTANEKCKCNKWIVWLKEAHTDEHRS